jgi:hypothetical protein
MDSIKFKRILFEVILAVGIGVLSGCGDNNVGPDKSSALTYLSNGSGGYTWVSVSSERKVVEEVNIREDLGLHGGWKYLSENYITYCTYNNYSISIYCKNLTNGDNYINENIYNTEDGETLFKILKTDDKVVLVLETGNGNYKIVAVDLVSGNINKIDLDYSYITCWYPCGREIIKGDKLFTAMSTGNGGIIQSIDLSAMSLGPSKEFTSYFVAYINGNELLSFHDDLYDVYDLNNFELKSSSSFNLPIPYDFGVFETPIKDSYIALKRHIAQPAAFSTVPVVYDLSSQSEIVDANMLPNFIRQWEMELGHSVGITDYAVDLNKQQIIIGYSYAVDALNYKFGLLYVNFKGDLLDDIEVDLSPDILILR